MRVYAALVLLCSSACWAVNPAFDPDEATGAGEASGTSSGSDRVSSTEGMGGSVGPTHSETGAAATTAGTSSDAGTGASTSTGTELGSSDSSGGEPEPADLGHPCDTDLECAEVYPGATCCTAAQCADTCMIPCSNVADCPAGMGCEHAHCLFPCMDDDMDCAAWPGYTCQHGGEFCEAD